MIKKVTLLLLISLLICSSFFSCYATSVPVTKENLTSTLQKFASSDANEKNYQIEVSDDVINITAGSKKYSVTYDLSGKPKFSFKASVKKGMTYEEFEEQTDCLILPIIGYIATANIQGASLDDLVAYLLPMYFQYALSSVSSGNAYTIVDDTVDGFQKPSVADPKVIYVSEFSERVMDFVNTIYKNSNQVVLDDTSKYNTFKLSMKKENEQENSCDIVSTVEVNLDADFSKLEGLSKQSGQNTDITKENADLVVDLKVGQKCKIQTNGTFNGYQLFGSGYDYQEINDKCVEITGTKVGTASGYIILNPDIKKSVYINVEENSGNAPLDTISLTINVPAEPTEPTEPKGDNKKEDEQPPKVQAQQTPSAGASKQVVSVLPKAGIKNIVYIVILLSIASIVIFGILTKKYKDIK